MTLVQCSRKVSIPKSIDYYLVNYNAEENILRIQEVSNLKGHIYKLSQKSYSYNNQIRNNKKDRLNLEKSTLTYDLEFNAIGEIIKMKSSIGNTEKTFLSFKKGMVSSEINFDSKNDTISQTFSHYDGLLLKSKVITNNGIESKIDSEIKIISDTTYVIGEYFQQKFKDEKLIESNIGKGMNNYTTYDYHTNNMIRLKTRYHNGKISTISSYNTKREKIYGALFVYENSNIPNLLNEIRMIFYNQLDTATLNKLRKMYDPKTMEIQIRTTTDTIVETFQLSSSTFSKKLLYTSIKDQNENIIKTVNEENGIITTYTYEFDECGNWIRKETLYKGKPIDVITRIFEYY